VRRAPPNRRIAQRLSRTLSTLSAFSPRARTSAAHGRSAATALNAAGKIHSDIGRGFIRAEVVAYEDFIRLGSEAKCREAGKLRLEGKDYVVRDGDIVHFRFAV
jgi:ribosome-binding ATPase YchF (GTP1/OBG family)